MAQVFSRPPDQHEETVREEVGAALAAALLGLPNFYLRTRQSERAFQDRIESVRAEDLISPQTEREFIATSNRAVSDIQRRAQGERAAREGRFDVPAVVSPAPNSFVEVHYDSFQKEIEEDLNLWRKKLPPPNEAGPPLSDERKSVFQKHLERLRRRLARVVRNELGNLHSDSVEQAMRREGIEKYRWTAVMDDRTRPIHRKLNSTIRRWSNPHPTERHPGRPVNCRCWAVAVF